MILPLLLALCIANGGVTDLPLIALPAKHPPHGTFAVMLTGDGGWRRIDARVTNRFRDAGVPVVGFLTPSYFKTRKTAEESACALERVVRYYKLHWKCDHVMLIGYSRGADVLPFMASRLPQEVRSSTEVIALLGLEPTIDFRYHASWIPLYHPREIQYEVKPELEKLRGTRVLCVYGEKEKDTLCRALDPQLATAVREPGSHHFGGRYSNIADVILESVAQPRKSD